MDIRVLGPVELVVDGVPRSVGRRQERALLAVLSLAANRTVPLDRLVDALWGQSPPERPADVLRVYLSRLRAAGLGGEKLTGNRGGYRLCVDPADVDAHRFAALAAEGRERAAKGVYGDAADAFVAADALWRGPALADLRDMVGLAADAAALEEARVSALEDRVEAQLACGEHSALAAELETLTRTHPLRERLWQMRMLALYRSGRQAEALRAYQQARRMLATEIGVEPGFALRDLERLILRQDPALSVSPAVRAGAAGPVALPPGVAARASAPFVGRRAELVDLRAEFGEVAAAGGRRVVLVQGDPGVGKTSLLTRAAVETHRHGALVSFGSCDEDLDLPYGPFVDALRHLVPHLPGADLAECLGPGAAELARLPIGLHRRLPELPQPRDADADARRYLLFAAVDDLVCAAARVRPLVLLLDDMHWASTATLLLLRHLARSADRAPVLIVGSYRGAETPAGHPLLRLAVDLRSEASIRRLDLTGLSESEAVELAKVLVGRDLTEREREATSDVCTGTGGNPFYLHEIVRAWAAPGGPAPRGAASMPESVTREVERRVQRLPAPCPSVLRTAAVAGPEFDAVLLAAACGLSLGEAVEALEAAVRSRIVEEVSGVGRFAFVHALVRRVLVDDMGPARRAELHRRVAEGLEALGRADTHVAELARHCAAATPVLGADPASAMRTVRYAMEAARRAMHASAYEEAVDHLEVAVRLTEREGGTAYCDALIALGEAQRYAGEPAHRETLLRACATAEALGDGDRAAAAALANGRGYYSRYYGVDDERVRAIEGALRLVGEAGPPATRARLLADLATEVHFDGTDRRLDIARDALRVAREAGDPATLAHVLAAAWFAARGLTGLAERSAYADELILVAGRSGSRTLEFNASFTMFLSAAERADAPSARRAFESCRRLAHELRQPMLRWRVAFLAGNAALAEGRYADIELISAEILSLAESLELPEGFSFANTSVFYKHMLEGEFGLAEALAAQMLARNPASISFLLAHAWVDAETGRARDAWAWLGDLAASRYASLPRDYIWLGHMVLVGEIVSALGSADHATAVYEFLRPYEREVGVSYTVNVGPVAHSLGILAATCGRTDDALGHFADAAAIARRAEMPAALFRTDLAWADLLLRQGSDTDRSRARQLAEEALGLARSLRIDGFVRRAEALCAALDQMGSAT